MGPASVVHSILLGPRQVLSSAEASAAGTSSWGTCFSLVVELPENDLVSAPLHLNPLNRDES